MDKKIMLVLQSIPGKNQHNKESEYNDQRKLNYIINKYSITLSINNKTT